MSLSFDGETDGVSPMIRHRRGNGTRRRKRLHDLDDEERFLLSSSSLASGHKLVLFILVAFVCGFFLGKHESTPVAVHSIWGRLKQQEQVVALEKKKKKQSISYLLGRFVKMRMRMDDEIEQQYGDYMGRLLDPVWLHEHVFVASDTTRERLQRRLWTKWLTKERFVWATAGDSSAAAHGNMFNQSYTAILQDTVRTILPFDFVARNYAMSWYQSAPELALCMQAIYGTDVDLLVWDFSMQEDNNNNNNNNNNHYHKMDLWIERALRHPNLPILLVIDHDKSSPRWKRLQEKLEPHGLGAILYDKSAVNLLRSRIPKTTTSSSSSLPDALENWICEDGSVEGVLPCEDPIRFLQCEQRDTAGACLASKYKTLPGCDTSRKSFHPGWREHLYRGRLMSLFLLDQMEDAMTQQQHGWTKERLLRMHQRDQRNATLVPLPTEYSGADDALLREWTTLALFRGPAVCHTALLPAESRFLGYATESSLVGTHEGGYDTGVNKLMAYDAKNNKMLLAYESTDRLRCASPKIDHKDFFIVRYQDKWVHTTVPNPSELRQYYHRDGGPLQGILLVCLQVCPMDKCADDYVGFGKANRQHGGGKIEMRVDGELVTAVQPFDQGCHVLEHEGGIRWGRGKAGDGRYKLSFRLHVKVQGLDYSIKISSIIVM